MIETNHSCLKETMIEKPTEKSTPKFNVLSYSLHPSPHAHMDMST